MFTLCLKSLSLCLSLRPTDRHHGTPMLLEGVRCIGVELEYDSEQSDWQGFDWSSSSCSTSSTHKHTQRRTAHLLSHTHPTLAIVLNRKQYTHTRTHTDDLVPCIVQHVIQCSVVDSEEMDINIPPLWRSLNGQFVSLLSFHSSSSPDDAVMFPVVFPSLSL